MSGEGLLDSRSPAIHGRTRIPRSATLCPVCASNVTIHGSESVSALVKTLWCRCSNLRCGMTFRMQLLFEHVISPSALPIPEGLSLKAAPTHPTTGPPIAGAPTASSNDTLGDGGGGDPEAPPLRRAAS